MFNRLVIVMSVMAIGGCAVSPSYVQETKEKMNLTANDAVNLAKSQRKQEGFLAKVNGNFYADEPIDLPYAAKLPAIFFETVTIRSKGNGFGTVKEAARNLSLATGLPVNVTPDVDLPPPMMKTGSTVPVAPVSNVPGAVHPSLSVVRLDFRGSTLNYIKQIAESGGVDWEYRDGAVVFSRIITRTFKLDNLNPGTVSVVDKIEKGGSASTGQSGGAGGSSSSSSGFVTAAGVAIDANYSPWAELKPAIESCLTLAGRLSISEGTGSITVTDTKDSVERVRKLVEGENAQLGKQVSVDVRTIKLRISDNTQLGLELDPIYSILQASGAATATFGILAPPTTRTTNGGQMVMVAPDATSRWYDSRGFIQALNQFGTVISDSTNSVVTTNRVPAMTAVYNTIGFLAQTTPAQGGGTTGGQGVPGLTPGSVTVGAFMRILPTIKNNNTIMLNMSADYSNLISMGSARTGAGQTEQQIQWANTDGNKATSNIMLNQGESLVISGVGEEGLTSNSANGIGGMSSYGQKTKFLFIIIVKPRVMKGL